MLISLSEALETPVSTLLGETVVEAEADALKAICEKLEVINLQLSQRKNTRRKFIHWSFVVLCIVIAAIFAILFLVKSPYLGWDDSNPETVVLGVAISRLGMALHQSSADHLDLCNPWNFLDAEKKINCPAL